MIPKLGILKRETFIISRSFWKWLSRVPLCQGFSRGWSQALGWGCRHLKPQLGPECSSTLGTLLLQARVMAVGWRLQVPTCTSLPRAVPVWQLALPRARDEGERAVGGAEDASETGAAACDSPVTGGTCQACSHALLFTQTRNLSRIIFKE